MLDLGMKCKRCPNEVNQERSTRMCTNCLEKNLANRAQWWAKHKDDPKYLQRNRDSNQGTRERLREKVFSHYGKECSCCGETELLFLELDHINNDGGKQIKSLGKIAQGGSMFYRWVVKNGFPKTLRTLCSNCNKGRWRNGGVCPHKA